LKFYYTFTTETEGANMTDRPTDRTAIALGYCVLQERQAVKQTRNVRVANRCNDLG